METGIISSIIIVGAGLLALAFKLCYSSNCKIRMHCGCLECERDSSKQPKISLDTKSSLDILQSTPSQKEHSEVV